MGEAGRVGHWENGQSVGKVGDNLFQIPRGNETMEGGRKSSVDDDFSGNGTETSESSLSKMHVLPGRILEMEGQMTALSQRVMEFSDDSSIRKDLNTLGDHMVILQRTLEDVQRRVEAISGNVTSRQDAMSHILGTLQLQVEGFGTGIAPTRVGQEMERAVVDPGEIILMAQIQMERRLEAFRAQFDRAWEGARQENQQWQSSIE